MKIELVLERGSTQPLLGSKYRYGDFFAAEFLNHANFSALRVICSTAWNRYRHTIRIPMFEWNVPLRRTRNRVDRGLCRLERGVSVLLQGEIVERTLDRRQTINLNLPEVWKGSCFLTLVLRRGPARRDPKPTCRDSYLS